MHVASAGDCRAVLRRGERAVRLTVDHTPKLPAEEERIVEQGGWVMRGRVAGIIAVSRALGDHELQPLVAPEPHVVSLRRSPCDRALLLASDGLWGSVTDEQAAHIANAAPDAQTAATLLVGKAIESGGKDNVSVIVVQWPATADSA